MRRLFTVLFILIASAAYAEGVITHDKVFFIPIDLQESQVLSFFDNLQKEYESQKSEYHDYNYEFVNMELTDMTTDSKNPYLKEYEFEGKCRIQGIEFYNITLKFLNKKLKFIDMWSEADTNTDVILLYNLWSSKNVRLMSIYPTEDNTMRPEVDFMFEFNNSKEEIKKFLDIDYIVYESFTKEIEIGIFDSQEEYEKYYNLE